MTWSLTYWLQGSELLTRFSFFRVAYQGTSIVSAFMAFGILHSPGTNNGLARSLARPRPLGDPDPGRASVRSAVNHLRGPVQPQRRTVRPRTVASALYDMLVQLSNIIGANFGSSGTLFECAVTD